MRKFPAHTRILLVFACLLIFFVFPIGHRSLVYASVSATASIDSMNTNSGVSVVVNIINNQSSGIQYVKISPPDPSTSIVDASSSWQSTLSGGTVTFTGQSIPPGANKSFIFSLQSVGTEFSQKPIGVEVSNSPSGSDPQSVSGSLQFSVQQVEVTNGPSTANVAVSVESTSFVVRWSTDIAASSVVEYGATYSYGDAAFTPGYTNLHTVRINDVNPNTVYYFSIDSRDVSGGSGGNYRSFAVTASTQNTPSITVTPTGTIAPTSSQTSTIQATPTSTLVPTPTTSDKEPPVIEMDTLATIPYNIPPVISGNIRDDSGVGQVLYSVNNGPYIQLKGIRFIKNKTVTFSLPSQSSVTSGTYTIIIKAIDIFNNVGVSRPFTYTIDRDPPKISVQLSTDQIMPIAPHIIGTVADGGQITKIEFSYNDGTSWQLIYGVITDNKIHFETDIPDPSREGIYQILVRATDQAGNISISNPYQITVDRLPPQSAGIIMRIGNSIVPPDSSDNISGMVGFAHVFVVSTAGGVTGGTVRLHSNNSRVIQIPLVPSKQTDLWEFKYTPDTEGQLDVSVQLTDGVNKPVTQKLFGFTVRSRECIFDQSGSSIQNSTITLNVFDRWQHRFIVWNGESHVQQNSLKTVDGCYGFLVTPGKYQLHITSPSTNSMNSDIITISSTTFLSQNVVLRKQKCFGYWCMPWIDQFYFKLHDEGNLNTQYSLKNIQLLQGENALLNTISKKEAYIVFLNTWMPDIANILVDFQNWAKNINKPVVIVFPYESTRYIAMWKQNGGYTLQMIADPDGISVPLFDYHLGPMMASVSTDGIILNKRVDIESLLMKY